jgi:hypothetical protein
VLTASLGGDVVTASLVILLGVASAIAGWSALYGP